MLLLPALLSAQTQDSLARISEFALSPNTLQVGETPTPTTTSDFNVKVFNRTKENLYVQVPIILVKPDGIEINLDFETRTIPSNDSYTFFQSYGELIGSQENFKNLPAGNYTLKAIVVASPWLIGPYSYADSFERTLIIVRGENRTASVPEMPLPLVFLTFAGVLALLYFKNSKH